MARQAQPMLRSLSRDLDSISHDMRGLLNGSPKPTSSGHALTLFPKVNVTTEEEAYLVDVSAPGVDKDSIDLSLEGRHLSISGCRRSDIPDNAKILLNERFQGRFRRVITLPPDADPERVQARSENGLIRIRVERNRANRTTIEIE